MTNHKVEDIPFDDTDPHFKDEVAEKIGLERIKPCSTCDACTQVCPVHEVIEGFDPRLIIHMILQGMRKEILSSNLIWFCCLCNSCFFECPQGIRLSRIVMELRKMAKDEGHVDGKFLQELEDVKPYLQDLCRRTMFLKVRQGFQGSHTMPCWRKHTGS